MQIAIISDVHNNEVNLKKVLGYCAENEIKKIICCGDLASLETLDFLNDNFSGEIFFVFGNMDEDFLKDEFFKCHPERSEGSRDSSAMPQNDIIYKNIKIFKDFGKAEIDGKMIAFVHFPEVAKKLCETGKYKFVFYGHTHKPFVSSVETTADQGKKKCEMLNPGNVAGDIFPPTFAIWNTCNDKFELMRVHNLK